MNKLVAVLSALSCLLVFVAHQNRSPFLGATPAVAEPMTEPLVAKSTGPQQTDNGIDEPDPPTTVKVDDSADTWTDEMSDSLETEYQLKKMITYLTPLMEIFHVRPTRWHRSVNEDNTSHVLETTGRRRGTQYYLSPVYYPMPSSYSNDRYADYASASSYGGGCCGGYGGTTSDDLLPILALVALSLLLLYLIALATTTTSTSGGKRKREVDQDIGDIVLLDGPTWLSLIHELWEQDGALEEPSCAQHTLCRMNRMAMAAPGQAGWAVSMSSLPLSYLLHHRHGRGFVSYMDASLMGRTGVNCTEVFSQCSRLQ